MLTGLDHGPVAVHEVDRAVAAYERLLGVPPSWRGARPARGAAGALFALSNAAVELVSPKPDAEESEGLRARLAEQGAELIALAFSIVAASDWSKALRERGLRATAPEEGEAVGRGGGGRRSRTRAPSPQRRRSHALVRLRRPEHLPPSRHASRAP